MVLLPFLGFQERISWKGDLLAVLFAMLTVCIVLLTVTDISSLNWSCAIDYFVESSGRFGQFCSENDGKQYSAL